MQSPLTLTEEAFRALRQIIDFWVSRWCIFSDTKAVISAASLKRVRLRRFQHSGGFGRGRGKWFLLGEVTLDFVTLLAPEINGQGPSRGNFRGVRTHGPISKITLHKRSWLPQVSKFFDEASHCEACHLFFRSSSRRPSLPVLTLLGAIRWYDSFNPFRISIFAHKGCTRRQPLFPA